MSFNVPNINWTGDENEEWTPPELPDSCCPVCSHDCYYEKPDRYCAECEWDERKFPDPDKYNPFLNEKQR